MIKNSPATSLDQLPETWVDQLHLARPPDLVRLLRHMLGKRRRAVTSQSLMNEAQIPTYLLAEYHGLPNGYFSKKFTRGYIQSFDKVMLGSMTRLRHRIASLLSGHQRVLDIGCGGGEQAAMLADIGVPEVRAIDASPYMVAHARDAFPHVPFSVRTAENTGFADGEFDAVCVSFVFHEIPPKFADIAIGEIRRILRPGGELIIAEPSALQMQLSVRQLMRRFGWRGPYFKFVARHTHEPFAVPWQGKNHGEWLLQHGFEVVEEEQSCPIHWWRARRTTG